MKILLASARTMNDCPKEDTTVPVYLNEAQDILNTLKTKSINELQNIWSCSDKQLADFIEQLNNIDLENNLSKAIECYDGVVFKQFKDDIKDNITYLNAHVRIISALYGVLKPSDGIQSYRLEMAAPLKINDKNLYNYWSYKIYEECRSDFIVNLASEEYAKCVRACLNEDDEFIDIDFIQEENGKQKHISTEMKKARGQYLKWMMKHNITNKADLIKFDVSNYRYSKLDSSTNKIVFIKKIKDMWC